MAESDTPRTDEAAMDYGRGRSMGCVSEDFARQLERELAEANHELAELHAEWAQDLMDAGAAQSARAAIIEECAQVCEALEKQINEGKATMRMQHHQGASIGASMCADRIRAAKERAK